MQSVVELLGYAVATLALTLGGLVVEFNSVQYAGAGQYVLAGWLAVLGALLLYGGVYLMGYQRLVDRLGVDVGA